jgi:hypothetical protein
MVMETTLFSSTIDKKIRRRISKIQYLSVRRYRRGLEFDDSRIPSGAYSVYFRNRSIGIKVLRTSYHGRFGIGGYKSPKRVRLSPAWQDAIDEFAALRIADSTGHTPIPYCVRVVRLGKKYYPAILMEHINGMPLGDFCYSQGLTPAQERLIYRGLDEIEKVLLQRCGIDHSFDSGGNNAIVAEHRGNRVKRLKLIDFSPGLIEIDPKRLEKALEDIPELWNHKVLGWKYSPVSGLRVV